MNVMVSNCPAWPVRTAAGLLIALSASTAAAAGAERSVAPQPAPAASAAARTAKAPKAPAVPARLVDLNSASRAELKTLPGVGDAEAERIIAGRPYLSKAELVIKNVMPTGPYLQLRHHVVAMPKGRPKGKG